MSSATMTRRTPMGTNGSAFDKVINPVSATKRVETVELTPEIATLWKERNTKNRKLRAGNVARMADAMVRSEWKDNGETMKFDRNGILLDGQNRIEAVLLSQATITVTVVYGLDPEVFDSLDQGAKRTTADVLYIGGEDKYAVLLASAMRFQVAYDNGRHDKMRVTAQQVRDALEKHPGMRESAAFAANKFKRNRMMPPSVAAFLHYQFSQRSRRDANAFFENLDNGINLSKGTPLYMLREQLMDNATNRSGRGGRFEDTFIAALAIKAWNAFHTGAELKVLRYVPSKEEYPKIR